MSINFSALKLRQLDRKLKDWQAVRTQQVPLGGWIRALRTSLGLTRSALAKIIGVGGSTIADFERSEAEGAITLKSLRKVASAMDCDLVYAIVPRKSLSGILEGRANEKAHAILLRVNHTMKLEDQAVEKTDEQTQVSDIVKSLLDNPKSLWK